MAAVREFTTDPDMARLTINRHTVDARQGLQNLHDMQAR